jgi:hypothetical protein
MFSPGKDSASTARIGVMMAPKALLSHEQKSKVAFVPRLVFVPVLAFVPKLDFVPRLVFVPRLAFIPKLAFAPMLAFVPRPSGLNWRGCSFAIYTSSKEILFCGLLCSLCYSLFCT